MTAPDPRLTFAELRRLLEDLPKFDKEAAAAARRRDLTLTKPPGALGRLEDIAVFIAGWQGRHSPRIERPLAAVFAGNHGVVAQGVAAYPQAVTAQMVANFRSGGAAINQLCTSFGVGLKVYELALDIPTRDFTREPALDEGECVGTAIFGMEAVAGGIDLLCLGEMGIGNTTVAAAVSCALFGGDPAEWVGPGTGVDAAGLARKAESVRRGLSLHHDHLGDPLEVLRRLGGRELAAIAGAILAARIDRVPVILDGYVVTAAAAVLEVLRPGALDHCLAGHRSAEPAHRRLLAKLDKTPLLDLGMRLGEGSGAVLAYATVKAALDIHNGMASFAEAGVSGRNDETGPDQVTP
jgi:nicotinate-nucleotide--dimethylbenzimidazole phosphoribosyltransferase